jgi:large conductance mechanosensitive channel
MWQDFKNFALRGSVVDLAIGIIIGSAFTTIVKSLVDDIIMPPIGLLLGRVNFSNLYLLLKSGEPASPYASLSDAQAAGAVTINYGLFVNNLISFLIVAIVTFLLVRGMNQLYAMQKKEEALAEATTKTCPYCQETVAINASRCPHCTSQLAAAS